MFGDPLDALRLAFLRESGNQMKSSFGQSQDLVYEHSPQPAVLAS